MAAHDAKADVNFEGMILIAQCPFFIPGSPIVVGQFATKDDVMSGPTASSRASCST